MKTKTFNIAEHLETDDDIREFLNEAAKGTASDFVHALSTAAKAKGMADVAKHAGVSRTSLYRSLSGESNPSFETITKIMQALGCHFKIA